MQLILLLAVLLLGSSHDGKSREIEELFGPETMELIGHISGDGGQTEAFMNEVREISAAVSAFAPLVQALKTSPAAESGKGNGEACVNTCADCGKPLDVAEILKPVQNIACDGLYNALARAVC